MQIREFDMKDYDRVIKIWKDAEEFHEEIDNPEVIREVHLQAPDLFLVSVEGGTVAGVIMGSFDGRFGMLRRLTVDPAFRGKGAATGLVTELEERLRKKGCRMVGLLVRKDDEVAVNLYKRNGYIESPQYLWMRKRL